ncbi:MAG: hypothetical protein Q9202_007529 [Teloschistes flavicans]
MPYTTHSIGADWWSNWDQAHLPAGPLNNFSAANVAAAINATALKSMGPAAKTRILRECTNPAAPITDGTYYTKALRATSNVAGVRTVAVAGPFFVVLDRGSPNAMQIRPLHVLAGFTVGFGPTDNKVAVRLSVCGLHHRLACLDLGKKQSDGADNSDEDLAGPTEEDLKELRKVHGSEKTGLPRSDDAAVPPLDNQPTTTRHNHGTSTGKIGPTIQTRLPQSNEKTVPPPDDQPADTRPEPIAGSERTGLPQSDDAAGRPPDNQPTGTRHDPAASLEETWLLQSDDAAVPPPDGKPTDTRHNSATSSADTTVPPPDNQPTGTRHNPAASLEETWLLQLDDVAVPPPDGKPTDTRHNSATSSADTTVPPPDNQPTGTRHDPASISGDGWVGPPVCIFTYIIPL